ncbi:copper chaperone PCu(A)C [Streptomyces barringtoniae]|uniref:copper chaperone PCu(A)C n=1 Tax=Streptomyces barringtoniae TaxID=2892029 RepID=UPI001E469225|nr:copper chaperone PCu(A)C [Streptomyces barringtoniae]MCC5479860.1 copper chaperone PCu(A)C [Streptomyces barringtoniae]
MSSSLRRGALAASAIVFSIASLAACGAGNDSQTLQVKPDNAATSVGNIKVQNATIITQPDLKSTGPAVISATLFNTGDTDETLQSVAIPGSTETVTLTPAKGGSLTVPAHGSLLLGGKGNASAEIPSGRQSVQDGNAQKVTFTFSKTGDVSLRAFVVPAASYFDKWGPSQIPTASASVSPAPGATASGSAKPGKHGKASPSATASRSATAGAGATPGDSASQSATGQ